jgi:hypothetical protein
MNMQNSVFEASFICLSIYSLLILPRFRFVIMGNLFSSDHTINRRFDLKESSLGRITGKPQAEIDEYTTLKDLDLKFIFHLQKQWFQRCNVCHLIFVLMT